MKMLNSNERHLRKDCLPVVQLRKYMRKKMVDMTMMMMTLRYEVICNFKKSTTCLILKDTFKSQLNPLHSSINAHILHTVLKTFPEVLSRRIC